MKRYLTVIFFAAISVCLLSFGLTAQATVYTGDCSASEEDNVSWSYDTDTRELRISGTGKMKDYNSDFDNPWYDYRYSITSLVVEDGVTRLGRAAFSQCNKLTEISLPDSLTEIGASCFGGCGSVEEVYIPKNVSVIQGNFFSLGCQSLAKITVDSANEYFVCDEFGALYDIGKTNIIRFPPKSTATEYELPNTVTLVGAGSFESCRNLKSIILPSSVTTIRGAAFFGCNNLESITIPESVTTIPSNAFGFCSRLKSITIPESVTAIQNYAFRYCTNLESITIPAKVTAIQNYAFDNCKNLTSIRFKSRLTTLSDNCLPNNDNLVISAPPRSNAEDYANGFGIMFEPYFIASGSCGDQGDNITWGIDEEDVLNITGSGAMQDYSEESAPWSDYCDSIGDIYIDSGVETVSNGAFVNCTSISSVYIPNSVTSIDSNSMPISADFVIKGKVGSEAESFANQKGIPFIADIIDSGKLGTSHSWTLDGYYTLRITGTGVMPDMSTYPWNSYKDNIKSIVIEEGVTGTGHCAFGYFSNLTNVSLPNSLTALGYGTFYECHLLESITLPENLKTIGDSAFYYCLGLVNVKIPDSVTDIGAYTFDCCENLKSINIPDGVKVLKTGVFENCFSLSDIELNDCLESIGEAAFAGCAFSSISLPETLTRIGNGVFFGCTALEKLYIPSSVTIIDGEILDSCVPVIVGYRGSYAENYAKYYGYTFEAFTFSVNYDLCGGIGDFPSQKKEAGAAISIYTRIPFKYGFLFTGWATKPDGEVEYKSGASYSADEDITLYAVWQIKTYTISYNANGGTGSFEAQTKTHNEDITLTSAVPTKEGYNFIGWSTSESGEVEYQSGATFTRNGDTTLYAVWSPKQYTVSFDANGGTVSFEAQTKTHNEDITLTSAVPTKDGYNFIGWSTSESGEVEYESGETFTKNEDTTLYAVWEIKTYKISYNAGGGVGSLEAQTKTHNEDITLTTAVPRKDGYNFIGWSTSESGEVEYESGATFTRNGDTTLYAVWQIKTYTISYNSNGGVGSFEAQTKTHNVDITLTSDVPTKEGYNFIGWSTSESAASYEYKSGATFTRNADTTLYAVWRIKTYKISYNANGGTGYIGSQTKKHGENIELKSDVPTKVGYNFIGWSTSESGEVEYEIGATFTRNEDTTLYAVWRIKTYTISYNANGGTGSFEAQTKIYNEDITLTSDVPTKEGYNFIGWSTSESSSIYEYKSGDTFTRNADTTFYAVWEIKTYKISYNANGGISFIGSQTKTYGENIELKSNVPTKDGYNFIGWSTSESGEVEYESGATFTKNEDTILYAVWEIKTYTIFYNANGGTGSLEAQTKTHNEDITLTSDVPTKEGYKFIGWSTSESASSYAYKSGDTFTRNADTTLYAVWQIKTYIISYNANGGTGSFEAQTKTHGENIELISDIPTKEGYNFIGWSTSDSGEAEYESGAAFSRNGDTTLYAVWSPKQYTVSFDANGGTIEESTKSVVFNDTYGALPTPVRQGYTFMGWFTSVTGNEEITQSTTVKVTSDCTLYAHWEVNNYTVTFNYNGGTEAEASKQVTYGSKYGTLPTSVRQGYTFAGWYTSTEGGQKVTASTYVQTAENHVLYAHWSVIHANKITLDKTSADIKIGSTVELNATVAPSGALDKSITWSSSNISVATVDENGIVTGTGSGTATITATTNDGGLTASCVVGVTMVVAPVSADHPSASIYRNTVIKLYTPTKGAVIYYTTNGSDPIANGIEYNGAVVITSSCTVKAVAKAPDGAYSEITSYKYTALWQSTETIQVSCSGTCVGGNVLVDVIYNNNPGMYGLVATVEFDSDVMSIVGVTNGEIFNEGEMYPSPMGGSSYVLYFEANKANTAVSGVLATIEFKVKDDAIPGNYPVTISYTYGDIINSDEEMLMPEIINGAVNVYTLLEGDVTADGTINMQDVLRLKTHLAGHNVVINAMTSDVNKDGVINLIDLLLIRRHLAGVDLIDKVTLEEQVEKATLTVGNARGVPGETVSVDIILTDNPGIWGLGAEIHYDKSILELVSVTNGEIFADGDMTLGNFESETYSLLFTNEAGFVDISTNGVLATLEFKIKSDISDCSLPITASFDDSHIAINSIGEKIAVDTVGGNIEIDSDISGVDVVPDINGDGVVTFIDIETLAKYLGGSAVDISTENSDIDSDGTITLHDLRTLIHMFIKGI